MLLLLVPILPFPVKETPALILRFAPLHLECCLCRNSLPPSPSILQTSRDMLVPYFPPILHFFHPPICLFALGVLPPLYHPLYPSPCPALYLVRPVGPLGPADGSPSLLLPSLRPPYARKILLYSPAPRPVCVAIPSGSHCDASSAPRPVLIPRARAEMLGPLCTRNISDTTSTSVHWPSAFCGSAMWLVAAPSNPGMPTCCASDGAHIICPRVCIPGVCTVPEGPSQVRLAPVRSVPRSSVHPRRDPLCSTRTALPTHCECPRRGEGFDPAAGTSLTRRPITLVYFPFPH
jgi:hypothetical protein